MRWRRVLAIFAVVSGAGLCAGEKNPEPVFMPAFREAAPFATTLRGADAAGLSLRGIAGVESRMHLEPGDSVTALVSHVDGRRSRQWIVHFVAQPLKEAERAIRIPEFVMHTNTGREIRFAGEVAAIAIRVLGPYEDTPDGARKAKDAWSGTLVNAQFLALGLDRCGALKEKIRERENVGPAAGFWIAARSRPYPPEVVAANQPIAARLGLEEADERGFVGCFPALTAFFEIVSRTQGLEEILRSVLNVPWWSVISSGGQLAPNITIVDEMTALDGGAWGLPSGMKGYAMKIRLDLNDRPALACCLAVTAPRPPLMTTGGVIGLAVQRPDGKGPHLMIRLLDTGTAPASGGASTAESGREPRGATK